MKSIVIASLLLCLLPNLNSQVVFCPPGAEWSYNFFFAAVGNQNQQYTFLEKIKYITDTIEGIDTLKILSHTKFYMWCDNRYPKKTYLKTKGDTIFYKNSSTLYNWQILYNFATPPGQSWVSSVKKYPGSTSLTTYTINVDSISYITVNSIQLKRLHVNQQLNPTTQPYFEIITERYGSNIFLFSLTWPGMSGCDGDMFQRNLCYKDSTFITAQFTAFPCDYSNPVGLSEYTETNKNVSVFPNPGSDFVELKADYFGTHPKIEFSDLSGRIVKQVIMDKSNSIDIRALEEGLYILSAFSQEGVLLGRGKFLKSQ